MSAPRSAWENPAEVGRDHDVRRVLEPVVVVDRAADVEQRGGVARASRAAAAGVDGSSASIRSAASPARRSAAAGVPRAEPHGQRGHRDRCAPTPATERCRPPWRARGPRGVHGSTRAISMAPDVLCAMPWITSAPPTIVSARSGFSPGTVRPSLHGATRQLSMMAASRLSGEPVAVQQRAADNRCGAGRSSRGCGRCRRCRRAARRRELGDARLVQRRLHRLRAGPAISWSLGGSDARNASLMRSEPSGIDHDRTSRRPRNDETSALPPPTSNVSPLVDRQVVHGAVEPEHRLVVAVDRLQRHAESMGAVEQFVPVGGVAHRRRRDGDHLGGARALGDRDEVAQGLERAFDRVRPEPVAESRSSRASRSGARASSITSRCSPWRRRNTIMRPEFEPMSTTANGRSSGAGSKTAFTPPMLPHRWGQMGRPFVDTRAPRSQNRRAGATGPSPQPRSPHRRRRPSDDCDPRPPTSSTRWARASPST